MNPEVERAKVFTRRAVILGGGKLALFATLIGRMYYLQVVEAEKYATLAEENRINLRLVPPPRGRIYDRHGALIAANRQSYDVSMISERTKRSSDIRSTLRALSAILELSPREEERILREIRRKRDFVPVSIRENLTWDEVSRIEVNAPDLPGITIEPGRVRHYPLGAAGAHVLGYVAAVSKEEQNGDPLLELPDFRIGKNGIERTYDLALRGTAGSKQIEVNAHGRNIRELSHTDSVSGQDVTLTLDAEIQRFTAQRLAEEAAIAVVMDIHGGEILALASSPSFDPAAFHDGIDHRTWRALHADPKKPLINKALAGQYAPGSTFKMCVALAGLESGLISRHQHFTCRGFSQLGSSRFHCWKRAGHGPMDLKNGIKKSCDVYFYSVARRIGVDRIAEMAHRLGLGAPTGIDIEGERAGFIPTRAWKHATMGDPWQPGEDLVAGIGQGYVLTTPLQLAVMTARLANGGKAVTPHIARDVVTEKGVEPRPKPEFGDIGISRRSLNIIRDAMNAVVNEGGTAARSRIKEEGMSMAGKTGTSQVRRITREERARGVRKNKDLPWHMRDHALFVAYGPVEKPRYAITVVVEHGGGGSRAAAPVAKDIMIETLRRDPLRKRPQDLAESPEPAKQG